MERHPAASARYHSVRGLEKINHEDTEITEIHGGHSLSLRALCASVVKILRTEVAEDS